MSSTHVLLARELPMAGAGRNQKGTERELAETNHHGATAGALLNFRDLKLVGHSQDRFRGKSLHQFLRRFPEGADESPVVWSRRD